MKRTLLFLGIICLISTTVWAAWDKTKPANNQYKYLVPADIRANWDAIELGTDAALQVTNAKVAAAAAIADTKLATISTAGKVSGAALTSLTSVPAGAGALPIANGGTGQATATNAINALLPSQGSNSGKVLVTNASNVSWGYPASLTIGSQAAGDLLYYNGSAWTRLGAGTSGYPLVSQGTTAPAYAKLAIANISATGTPSSSNFLRGDGAWINQTVNSQLFTSTGSFTVPTGVTTLFITAVGGGGGGGSGDTNVGGGGGGGGAFVIKAGVKVTAGNSYTVTIGAHGVGVGGANDGTAGTSTSFPADNVTLTCAGGGGGLKYSSGGTGGAGGVASGSYSASGATAGSPVVTAGGTGGTRTGEPAGGGAGSPFGVGGVPVVDSAGGVGTGYGVGGAGGSEGSSYQTGGNGTDGLVFIEW